jgi:hypothetical protein
VVVEDSAVVVTSVAEGVIQVVALAVVVAEPLTSQVDPHVLKAELSASQAGLAHCQ